MEQALNANSPWRVAHICQLDDMSVGGSLSVARALVAEQRRLGIDARLVFLYAAARPADARVFGLPAIHCDVPRPLRWLSGPSGLLRALRNFAPHIVHHHDGILWPRLATRLLRQPIVTHAHLGWPLCSRISRARLAQRVIAATTDCLLTVSPWVGESWAAAGFSVEKMRSVPNGVDPGRFRPLAPRERTVARHALGWPEDWRIVLWVGRLDRETKGLDRLVAVVGNLGAEVRVVIAGDGPDRRWLESALDKQARCRVDLLGAVAEPARLFAAADALLFTSRIETFGLVLLEAAACALPIYAFECAGGAQELLRITGATVVKKKDVARLAQRLLVPQDSSILRARAERVRREWSWRGPALRTVHAYRELLDGFGEAVSPKMEGVVRCR